MSYDIEFTPVDLRRECNWCDDASSAANHLRERCVAAAERLQHFGNVEHGVTSGKRFLKPVPTGISPGEDGRMFLHRACHRAIHRLSQHIPLCLSRMNRKYSRTD